MKTAVSIPQDIYESAEKLAKQLGKSRSQVYSQALKIYLEKQRSANVTKQLNKVYGSIDSSLDPVLAELQSRSLTKDVW